MKKTILLAIFINAFLCFGQTNVKSYSNYPKEIKLNIGLFLASSTLEGTYEHYLGSYTSIGGIIYFDSRPEDFNGEFGIGSNFRAYLHYSSGSGFFGELFGLYYSGKEDKETIPRSENRAARNYASIAFGVGVGYKWITRDHKFSLEMVFNLGRNIIKEDFQNSFMLRGGLLIGYRF